MTDRLYYNDPFLREFDAIVRGVAEREGRLVVTLDRTAFYPTSGGQPFDTGSLGSLRVVDVMDEDENGGTIEHVLDPALAEADMTPPTPPRPQTPQTPPRPPRPLTPGLTVHGVIDWGRRFDHMQQHTGQHVLSAAFDKLFGVRTVSFHLGAEASTIDLRREVQPSEIAAAETEANRIVWDDRPVTIRYATAEEAAAMPLRKESVRGGTLRLIDVEGFDLSACGGTHVARTGAIGVIAIGSWERFKGGQRIEFVCGGRALARWRSLRGAVGASIRLLSVLPEELPASIERLQAEMKAQRRALGSLQGELARFRAGEISAAAETVQLKSATGDTRAVRLVLRAIDADAAGLKTIATAIIEQPSYIVVLISTSRPAFVVVARSADFGVMDSRTLLSSLTATFGGRGGGKAELAQGGGLDATGDAILAAARAALT